MLEPVGWIKLHRTIMKSETFECLNAIQKLIAIYIIVNANHEDGVWHDKYKNVSVPVKRGQLITSRSKIVNEWFGNDKDVTEQKVRTALKKLEKIGFLTMESTKAYTRLTVCNYWVYQKKENEDNQGSNPELTKDQPSVNHELTTNKNVKNEKNEKNLSSSSMPGPEPLNDGPENPFNAYYMAFGPMNTFVSQEIGIYLDEGMEPGLVTLAIEKAAKNGSKFQYAKAILDRWLKSKILTVEAAVAAEEEFNKRKVERIHGNKRPQANRPIPNIKGSNINDYDFSSKRNSL